MLFVFSLNFIFLVVLNGVPLMHSRLFEYTHISLFYLQTYVSACFEQFILCAWFKWFFYKVSNTICIDFFCSYFFSELISPIAWISFLLIFHSLLTDVFVTGRSQDFICHRMFINVLRCWPPSKWFSRLLYVVCIKCINNCCINLLKSGNFFVVFIPVKWSRSCLTKNED